METSYCSNSNYGLVCLRSVFIGIGMISCSLHRAIFFSSLTGQCSVSGEWSRRPKHYQGNHFATTAAQYSPSVPVLRAWTTFKGSRRISVGSCTCQNSVLRQRAGPSNGAYQMTPDKRPPHTTCSSFARNHFIWSVRLQITVMPKPKLYELQQIHDFCAGGKFL